MDVIRWIVISYNLPTEPSRHRVSVWRALKKLGVVNIQQSMWIMPYNNENYDALSKISAEIEQSHGEALLMKSVIMDKTQEDRIISTFNDVRNEEYKELISECRKYLKEIEKEIAIEKFTFAELEEEEEELEKLISWHSKIAARDAFKASEGEMANDMLIQIRNQFEKYSDMVYEKNKNEID